MYNPSKMGYISHLSTFSVQKVRAIPAMEDPNALRETHRSCDLVAVDKMAENG